MIENYRIKWILGSFWDSFRVSFRGPPSLFDARKVFSIQPETESGALYIDWNCDWNSASISDGFVVYSFLT